MYCPTLDSTVSSLKDKCRLAILLALKRKRYSLISLLPIPTHLQQFLSLGRSWEQLPEDIQILCPIDPEELEREKEEEEGGTDNSLRKRIGQSPATICHINNGRSLILNVNGMLIQVKLHNLCVCSVNNV